MPTPETYHIIPLNDLRPHEASIKCWCRPVMDDDELDVYIHNALDRRENYQDRKCFH